MLRQQTPLVKVLIVGADEVGKTSLVQKFVFDEFLNATPTIGINFAQKICLGETGSLNLSIWDLSGQPRFRFLAPQFCSGACGVVLVVDQTRPDTLEEATKWLDLLRRFAHPSHRDAIVLALAKADLPSHLSHQQVQAFCHIHGIFSCIPCSAKTGKNIAQVFVNLTTAIQRSQLEGKTSEPPFIVSI